MEGSALYTRFGSLDRFGWLEGSRGSSRGPGLIPSDVDSLWFGSSAPLVFCFSSSLITLVRFDSGFDPRM
jgi:hypothetical protein